MLVKVAVFSGLKELRVQLKLKLFGLTTNAVIC